MQSLRSELRGRAVVRFMSDSSFQESHGSGPVQKWNRCLMIIQGAVWMFREWSSWSEDRTFTTVCRKILQLVLRVCAF